MKHLRLNIVSKEFTNDVEFTIKFDFLRDVNHNIIPLNKPVLRCEIQYQFRKYPNDISYVFNRKNSTFGDGSHSLFELIMVIPIRFTCFERIEYLTSTLVEGDTKLLKVKIKDGIRNHTR